MSRRTVSAALTSVAIFKTLGALWGEVEPLDEEEDHAAAQTMGEVEIWSLGRPLNRD